MKLPNKFLKYSPYKNSILIRVVLLIESRIISSIKK